MRRVAGFLFRPWSMYVRVSLCFPVMIQMSQVLIRDEDWLEAEGALRRVVNADSDCDSIYESFTGKDEENVTVEGEKVLAAIQTQTRAMELLKPGTQNTSEKRFTRSFWGGAAAYDRRPAGRAGSARGSPLAAISDIPCVRGSPLAAASEIPSSMFADTAESLSVRSKVGLFESTAPSLGGEETKLTNTTGRMARHQRSSKSLPGNVLAHESTILAATSSTALSVAYEHVRLRRSRSFQAPARASPPPMAMARTDARVTDDEGWPSRGS